MLGKGCKRRVQRRLEPQRLDDGCLQIVADDRPGDAAEEGERSDLTIDPVRQLLAEAGKGEGVGGSSQHGHEDLRLMDDAGLAINDRHRLAGIVGLHHRAGLVAVAEGRARPLLEGGKPLAEPGEAVTLGVVGAIFLP
jgi:hypothetical protein